MAKADILYQSTIQAAEEQAHRGLTSKKLSGTGTPELLHGNGFGIVLLIIPTPVPCRLPYSRTPASRCTFKKLERQTGRQTDT